MHPAEPSSRRSRFSSLLSFFFFSFTSVLFQYVRGPLASPAWLVCYPDGCSRLRRGRGLQGIAGSSLAATCSPLILQKRWRQNAASYMEDLQRYKDLLLSRCLDGRWRALLLWRTSGNPNMWTLCTARPLESRRTTTSLIWHTDCCSSTPRGEF